MSPEVLEAESRRVAMKMLQAMHLAADREPGEIVTSAMMRAMAGLLVQWSKPGHQVAMLCNAADYLSNEALRHAALVGGQQ